MTHFQTKIFIMGEDRPRWNVITNQMKQAPTMEGRFQKKLPQHIVPLPYQLHATARKAVKLINVTHKGSIGK